MSEVHEQDDSLYLKIDKFDNGIYDYIKNKLDSKEYTEFFIDLRGSNRGVFSEILKTLSIFIEKETDLFYLNENNIKTKITINNNIFQPGDYIDNKLYKNNIKILIDEETEGGSLLFAYSLMNNNKKVLINGNNTGIFKNLYLKLEIPEIKNKNSNDKYFFNITRGEFFDLKGQKLSGNKLYMTKVQKNRNNKYKEKKLSHKIEKKKGCLIDKEEFIYIKEF